MLSFALFSAVTRHTAGDNVLKMSLISGAALYVFFLELGILNKLLNKIT